MRRIYAMVATAVVLLVLGGCGTQHADASDAAQGSHSTLSTPAVGVAPSPTPTPTATPTPTPTASPTGTPTPGVTSITYTIKTIGSVTANMNDFASTVAKTLNDRRGWASLGLAFEQVPSGGRFTIWMAASDKMTTFAAGCSALYSCTVGSNVIINQDRWLGASPSWTGAGGTLADYRVMVINHETGHWLGHAHEHCSAPGAPAPVMQQQTISMEGCTTNSWPLPNERTAPRLGIR